MLSIVSHFDKDNLHHAYLIEGQRSYIMTELLKFLKSAGITINSPDFFRLDIDNLKITEALALKKLSREKGFQEGKRVFVICTNHITLDAQNTMLRLFEEPITDTHFFLIIPDLNAVLRTLTSRFYVIKTNELGLDDSVEYSVKEFLDMGQKERLDFIKDLLASETEDNSKRTIALEFLNNLETTLLPHRVTLWSKGKGGEGVGIFEQIMKARQYLRQPGASPKMLLESVALSIK